MKLDHIMLTSLKGDTNASLCINITDNNNLGNGKFFTLTINRTTLHPEIIPVAPESAIVTIQDDESKNIKLIK